MGWPPSSVLRIVENVNRESKSSFPLSIIQDLFYSTLHRKGIWNLFFFCLIDSLYISGHLKRFLRHKKYQVIYLLIKCFCNKDNIIKIEVGDLVIFWSRLVLCMQKIHLQRMKALFSMWLCWKHPVFNNIFVVNINSLMRWYKTTISSLLI